jgi:hypothetical protein
METPRIKDLANIQSIKQAIADQKDKLACMEPGSDIADLTKLSIDTLNNAYYVLCHLGLVLAELREMEGCVKSVNPSPGEGVSPASA